MGNVRDDESYAEGERLASYASIRFAGVLENLKEAEERLVKHIDAKIAELDKAATPEYKLECLRLSLGNVDHAKELFAFIMEGQ